MNKYTLTFKDQRIEEKYKIHKAQTLQFPTATIVLQAGTLILLINLVIHLSVGKYINVIMNGVTIMFSIGQYKLIGKYAISRSNLSLTISNIFFFMFECLPQKADEGYYDGYILGCNQMLAHSMLMFANNLGTGIALNILLAGARILIMNYRNGYMQPQQYVYTIILSLCFLLQQFEVEKQQRKSFMYSLKDSTWEYMIPMFLKKPYLLFSFQKEDNSYKLHSSFQLEYFQSETPLTSFLYQAKTKQGQSLSSYIHNMTEEGELNQLNQCLFNNYLNVEYQQKQLQLSVFGCQFEKIMYAVIVENEDPLSKEQSIKFGQKIQLFKDIITQQIIPINKVLGAYLQETYHPLLRNLRIALIEIYYMQNFNYELKLVNIKKLLFKCARLFQTPDNSIRVICDDNLKFVTLKHALITLLFELLKTVQENDNVMIEIAQQQKITLQIMGIQKLPRTELFQLSKQILVEKVIQFQQSNLYVIVGIILILMKSPSTNFTEIKSLIDHPFL